MRCAPQVPDPGPETEVLGREALRELRRRCEDGVEDPFSGGVDPYRAWLARELGPLGQALIERRIFPPERASESAFERRLRELAESGELDPYPTHKPELSGRLPRPASQWLDDLIGGLLGEESPKRASVRRKATLELKRLCGIR